MRVNTFKKAFSSFNFLKKLSLAKFEPDWQQFEETEIKSLKKLIKLRKSDENPAPLIQKYKEWRHKRDPSEPEADLVQLALQIPNRIHPDVPIGDESQSRLVCCLNKERGKPCQALPVVDVAVKLKGLLHRNVSHTSGTRSYHFTGDLARLEQALLDYTVDKLQDKGFELIYVPDLLHESLIERCGFPTRGKRTQVYRVDDQRQASTSDVCLSGTAEMALAGYVMNQTFDSKQLPLRLCAVSRCFRAEVSDLEHERGIYRVHHFTKVEMFAVTEPSSSDDMHQQLLDIEKELFTELELRCRVLDMASEELGASAYRKYDIEAWMSAKQFWGEISSTSNCTDYQARRLAIRVMREGSLVHAHTLNGTALAAPRVIMALLEANQASGACTDVTIPEVLWPYMQGDKVLRADEKVPRTKWMAQSKLRKHYL